MRRLVGPTDPAAYENPSRTNVYPYLPAEAFERVLDFGCGCGRVARQLLQQRSRPVSYLGLDLHRGMIEWCGAHLSPVDPAFDFRHHDVFEPDLNPSGRPGFTPFPAAEGEFTLVNAISVFTHLVQQDAEQYFAEVVRVLAPRGMLHLSWFLFDKRDFPMLQPGSDALYASVSRPTGAVLFDRGWLLAQAKRHGLAVVHVVQPELRGYQWVVVMTRRHEGVLDLGLPPDEAPRGAVELPQMPPEAWRIGEPPSRSVP
jgi:SAM-dependent methyltransferase